MVRRGEKRAVQVRRIDVTELGVAHHDVGEGVGLEIVEEVRALRTGQIVHPVAELQGLHLVLEHVVEGRAQHAAELGALLGQAADPQIDQIEAATSVVVRPGSIRRPGAGCIEEVEAISRGSTHVLKTSCLRRRALASEMSSQPVMVACVP